MFYLTTSNLLPTSVDLRPDVDRVPDQGSYGSCTANAGCSCMEILYRVHTGVPIVFSRMYLYYYERKINGDMSDIGVIDRDIGEALKLYGVCKESTWGYTKRNLMTLPNHTAVIEGMQYRIVGSTLLQGDRLTAIKKSVANQTPVLLSMLVHLDFMQLTGDWKTHSWATDETYDNPVAGGHEVLVIGYDDVSRHLLIENSWGSSWGDGGFGGIPYDMIDSNIFGNLWTLAPNFK